MQAQAGDASTSPLQALKKFGGKGSAIEECRADSNTQCAAEIDEMISKLNG